MAFTRIQVPISDEARVSLQSLADAQRSSLAAVCGELLEQTAPVAAEMAKALQMAKQAPTRALRDMAETLDKFVADANQMQIDLDDKLSPKATRRKYIKKTKTA
jgi:hypothetical protein